MQQTCMIPSMKENSNSFDCFEEISCSRINSCNRISNLKYRTRSQSPLLSFSSVQYEYMPNPYYLSTMQENISASMRSVLYDWIMEVCSELTLKRETFHLSVNYVDRFLSRLTKVNKQEYQLLGLASMVLAAKIEEVLPPRLEEWANSADNGYSIGQIIAMEKKILRTIDFKVLPITAYNIINWLMGEWDNFIKFHFGCVNGNWEIEPRTQKEKADFDKRMIFFKQSNQQAYQRFRETMQVLDLSVLHSESMLFLPKHLACGLLYLMISKFFYETNYSILYFDGENRDDYAKYMKECDDLDELERLYLDHTAVVQDLFTQFIEECAEIQNLEEIYPSVTFLHPFLDFEATFELPVACKVYSQDKIEAHYEEFLAFQTHNPKFVEFLTNNLNNLFKVYKTPSTAEFRTIREMGFVTLCPADDNLSFLILSKYIQESMSHPHLTRNLQFLKTWYFVTRFFKNLENNSQICNYFEKLYQNTSAEGFSQFFSDFDTLILTRDYAQQLIGFENIAACNESLAQLSFELNLKLTVHSLSGLVTEVSEFQFSCPIHLNILQTMHNGQMTFFTLYRMQEKNHVCQQPVINDNEEGPLRKLVSGLLSCLSLSAVPTVAKQNLLEKAQSLTNRSKRSWINEKKIAELKVLDEENKSQQTSPAISAPVNLKQGLIWTANANYHLIVSRFP